VKHPIPVARLCHLLADFGIRDERLSTGSGAVKLRNFAAELSSIPPNDPHPKHELASAVAAQLLIDRRHEQSIRYAIEHSRNRVVVASHRLQTDACNQLLPLLARVLEQGKKLEVTYGIAESDSETVKSYSEFLTKLGGTFSRDPNLHGKYVVVDDETAIIGSYNWLNGSQYARRRPGVEVGINLSGATVGRDLLSACAALLRPRKKPRN
jgi:phosphatidylserine/phosphatidylglycerophosphate/cardiolipin synthase-like enzyme